MNRILLKLKDIPSGTSVLSLSEDVESLELQRDEYVFYSPVKIDLEVDKSEQGIMIAGRATVPTQVECARCLSLFADEAGADFHLRYIRTRKEADTEQDSPDDGLYYIRYDESEIDLTDEIRQALVVSLPIRALCDPGCKGLCSLCGANLNEGGCSCSRREGHPAWSALEKLRDGRDAGRPSGE